MSIHFLNHFSIIGNDTTASCLCYKFNLSCDKKVDLYDMASKQTCGPSLVPGIVLENSSLPCSFPMTKIRIPPCQTYANTISSVDIKEDPLLVHEDWGNPTGMSQVDDDCKSCFIWTSTTKRANKSCAPPGDIITYKIIMTNHSLCTLDMVWISDEVPTGVSVVPGSIHPSPKPGETLKTGISVGSVPACSSVELTYQVRILSCTSKKISNFACVRYCYKDCSGCMHYGIGKSTQSIVKILPLITEIFIFKSADKRFVSVPGENIHYTLSISNTGNSIITDITVYDDIPKGLCYEENSTRRNNCDPVDENPAHGIYIEKLLPGETCTVTFILVVCTSICSFCQPTEFINTARACGHSFNRKVSAKSEPWAVTMNGRCFY